MIYTVTFNPSLDYIVSVKDFKAGVTNRTTQEIVNPGGKGINVSIVLSNLGLKNIALGFYAGFTGEKIVSLLEGVQVKNKLIRLADGNSRINVKCRNVGGDGHVIDETEINGLGPKITDEALAEFNSQIDALTDGDILVMSGSVPSSLPATIYKDIMQTLQNRNVKIVVDTTKDFLLHVLEFKPFLVKPNKHELEEIFDVEFNSTDDIEHYARELKGMGATNVLVSLDSDGALLVAENGQAYKFDAPKGEVKNSVGSGDSMIAGFLYGYMQTNDYEHSLKYGIACGSASAFSVNFATKSEIMDLLNSIK